jgi:hypothetical protein
MVMVEVSVVVFPVLDNVKLVAVGTVISVIYLVFSVNATALLAAELAIEVPIQPD